MGLFVYKSFSGIPQRAVRKEAYNFQSMSVENTLGIPQRQV
jgi:hypothetical protein